MKRSIVFQVFVFSSVYSYVLHFALLVLPVFFLLTFSPLRHHLILSQNFTTLVMEKTDTKGVRQRACGSSLKQ